MTYNESILMDKDYLEDILSRLNGCRALVNALYEMAGASVVPDEALSGILDLLNCICRDFEADINAAEAHTEKAGKA